ncbi:serine/threonine-protein kinase [Actinomadura sp. HBU206391]|uniref:serine/threonine-protein kinase n=1 Tax=Actinomadura sp. HBU206391 TaxID=2731692 RepID=UPI00164F1702|nr:serine/threonine-protein kinase [Actinomadura sp. HBU206391]MBC6456632.1 protein kinase [Actinomadura sp. HBU206391]
MADRRVGGRYRLLDRLGSGGMSTVWRAHDEVLGRPVAVKEIEPPEDVTPGEREVLYERVAREARAAAMLDHPGVVTVHDVVTEAERPWIVMELVEGRSLHQAIEAEGPLAPERVARIGLHLLNALAVAHGRGLLHRDVTPANVLLAANGRVVLTDFGIAAIAGDPALTRTGTLLGTPGFVAPERLRDMPYGPASDLWSLGATLYTAAEGRAPFARDAPLAALGAVLAEDPPEPRRSGPLAPVLEHLLAKDPAVRITAEQARAALRRVTEGEDAGLPRLSRPRRTARMPRRRVVWIVTAVVVAAAVATTIVGVGGWPRGDEPGSHETPGAPASPRPIRAGEVRPCSILTDEQVRGIISDAVRHVTDTGGCDWWDANGTGFLSALTIEVLASPTEAHDRMAIHWNNTGSVPGLARKGAATEWSGPKPLGEVKGTVVPPAMVSGVGDEAYSYGMHGSSAPVDCMTLLVRAGNVIAGVRYCGRRDARFPAPEAARRGAAAMVETLVRLQGRG